MNCEQCCIEKNIDEFRYNEKYCIECNDSVLNAIRIYKNYEFGNETDGGYYKWLIEKIIITKNELQAEYDLSMPIWKNLKNIILAVNEFSGYQFYNINVIATELFNQHICGDCIIYFENYNNKQFEIISNILKTEIIKLGVNEDNIRF